MTDLNRRWIPVWGIAACLAGLAACAGPQAKTAWDPSVKLGAYRTYAWAQVPTESGAPASSALDQSIKADVDQQLAAKGLEKVAPSQAQLIVSYSAVAANSMTYGVAPGPAMWGPDYEIYPTRVGSLTLQFSEPRSDRIVWQGTATDVIGETGASQKDIATAVKDLLRNYPVG